MSIRKKTILATTAALLFMIIALDAAIWITITRSFGEMEQREAGQSALRGATVIHSYLVEMDKKSFDWAAWDDSYEFMKNKNQAYIDSNLSTTTLVGKDCNFMLYYTNAGKLLYAECADIDTNQKIQMPDDIKSTLCPGSVYLTNKSTTDYFQGIIATSRGPLLFAKRPITKSSGEGPVIGTLIFARYLDSTLLKNFSDQYAMSLDAREIGQAEADSGFAAAEKAILSGKADTSVLPLNSDKIAGFCAMKDVFGKPAVIIGVVSGREINTQAIATVKYTTIGLIIAGLLFGILNLIWLDKIVLRRVTGLDCYVKGVLAELGLK